MSDTFKINRGSTRRCQITFPNGSGGAADLTGHTVSAIEVSAALQAAGGVTLAIINPAGGIVEMVITDETTAQLALGRIAAFRIRIGQPNGDSITTNLLWLDIE